jgi:MYXO-CTERM domain-containing protein
MVSARFSLGVAITAIALMVPASGRAQTCTADSDCAKGLTCQDNMSTAPAVCYPDEAGTGCLPVADPAPASKSCQLAPCASDADCGAEMVCQAQPTVCTGSTPSTAPCAPNTDCTPPPAPEPPDCTTPVSTCVYRWALPCTVNADCGEGFECVPRQAGTCSGSNGSAASGTPVATMPTTGGGTAEETGGATGSAEPSGDSTDSSGGAASTDVDAGTARPVECTVVETYPGYCQSVVKTCAQDSDCPSVWTCKASYDGVTTTTVGAPPDVATPQPAPAPMPIDGGAAPVAVTQTKTCQQPGAYEGPTKAVDGTTQTGGELVLNADGGTAVGNSTPPSPNAPGASNAGPSQVAASTSGGGGCSLTTTPGTRSAGWLAGLLVGLALLTTRRRRSR